MGRERNQRSAESSRKIGIRKTATPNTCNARSLTMAPKTPIQLCAGRPAGGFDAVFSEGSSGEYETRARTRRTAKTKTRKPISSLSRRLAVGVNVRATMFILTYGFAAEPRRCLGPMLPAPASFGAGRHDRPSRSETQRVMPGILSTPEPEMIIPKRQGRAAKFRRAPVADLVSPRRACNEDRFGSGRAVWRQIEWLLAR